LHEIAPRDIPIVKRPKPEHLKRPVEESRMSNYPAGAWEDPNAPWNAPECPRCGEYVEESITIFGKEAKCLDCGWELDYFLE
jgi:hypothetical protein